MRGPKGHFFSLILRIRTAAIGTRNRATALIGAASDELAAALDTAGRAYVRAGDLPTAVALAAGDALPGDIVLLSPACASFDQFGNFEERGDTFRRLVEELR